MWIRNGPCPSGAYNVVWETYIETLAYSSQHEEIVILWFENATEEWLINYDLEGQSWLSREGAQIELWRLRNISFYKERRWKELRYSGMTVFGEMHDGLHIYIMYTNFYKVLFEMLWSREIQEAWLVLSLAVTNSKIILMSNWLQGHMRSLTYAASPRF
jgi:hypothetical protein